MAHHRSGSNFLNDLLQAHPHVECINEPLSMHTNYFRGCDLSCWTQEDFDPELLHPSLASHRSLRSYLIDFRAYLLQSTNQRVIGFKETVLFGKLGWLKAFLPSLKVLFLKRDPHAIVASVLRTDLLPFWDYAHLVPPAFKALHPGYVPNADLSDRATAAAEMVAMSVAVRYDLAQRAIQNFEHMELQLGELINDPVRQLEAIAKFLGVEAHEEQLAFLRHRQGVTRGGAFSSFRLRHDVEHGWRRHLNANQIRVIDGVLQCA
jgi:hypothetical protein